MSKSLVVTMVLLSVGLSRAADIGARAVDVAWTKAMKANALDKVVELYATNAVAWFPGEAEANGREAIRASYANLFATHKILDVVLSDTHYRNAESVSAGWGKATITVAETGSGKTNVWNARYTDVAALRNGKWVYIVDHASAEPEPVKK